MLKFKYVKEFKNTLVVTNSLPPPLFFTWKIWRPTRLRRAVCELKKPFKKQCLDIVFTYVFFFQKMMDDVEKSVNEKDYQSSTIRCLLYISKFVLGQLNHIPIILISLLFVSTSISDWFSEYECIVISAISSWIINLIFYVMKSFHQLIVRE